MNLSQKNADDADDADLHRYGFCDVSNYKRYSIRENPCYPRHPRSKMPFKTAPQEDALSALLDGNDRARFEAATGSYRQNWEIEFSQEKDVNHITGEENIFRYLPLKNCVLRVQPADSLCDVLMIVAASRISRTPITISIAPDDPKLVGTRRATSLLPMIVVQDEVSFINDMHKYERIRVCSPEISDDVYKNAAKLGKYIATAPPLAEGRIEMLHYLKEQSITFEYHRYGSISE